jgi:hypothetical protein
VARALPALPKISEMFKKGRVSYSKVRAMTRVATPDNEDVLMETALHGTASQVEKQVRYYRLHKRIEKLKDDNKRFAQRRVNLIQDDDDTWVIRGRLTTEQGALLKKALDLGTEQMFQEQKDVPQEVEQQEAEAFPLDQSNSETAEARRADALERMASAFLAQTNSQANGGDAYLVNIHTDVQTLRADGEGADAEIEEHGCVSAETSRRVACDASIVHWLETHKGEPLSIGRKTRTVPPAIRRSLHKRDGGCRFPGCNSTRFVDAHHIKHWADGGETSMDNLVLLCRRHHRLVHEEGYGIQNHSHGELTFTLPGGKPLQNNRHGRFRGNVLQLELNNIRNGLKVTPQTAVPNLCDLGMDYDLAVLALIQADSRGKSRKPASI